MENIIKISSLDANSRRILLDAIQLYDVFLQADRESEHYKGGMHWKKSGQKEYLFKSKGSRGYGESLGVRSPQTEHIYVQFHEKKIQTKERKKALFSAIKKHAKFCVAAGINRVPKVSANIVRRLDHTGLMGHGLRILGSHAIFAYESAAGVSVANSLMTTQDIDLLLHPGAKGVLRLSGDIAEHGLMGILRKVDRTFEIEGDGHFRASNSKGFMVELVKPVPNPPHKIERQSLSSNSEDLIAAEMEGFVWLQNAPLFVQTVIAEDGFPVRFNTPDPRIFALNKLWISQLQNRNPIKRPRDRAQAEVVAQIATDYLGLNFEDDILRVFPSAIRNMLGEIVPHSPNEDSTDMLFPGMS